MTGCSIEISSFEIKDYCSAPANSDAVDWHNPSIQGFIYLSTSAELGMCNETSNIDDIIAALNSGGFQYSMVNLEDMGTSDISEGITTTLVDNSLSLRVNISSVNFGVTPSSNTGTSAENVSFDVTTGSYIRIELSNYSGSSLGSAENPYKIGFIFTGLPYTTSSVTIENKSSGILSFTGLAKNGEPITVEGIPSGSSVTI